MINFVQIIEENPILLKMYRVVSSWVQLLPYYIMEEYHVDNIMLDFPLGRENTEFAFLTPVDMAYIGNHKESSSTAEDYLQLLEGGCLCLAIKYRGEIAAYSWCNLTFLTYKGRSVALRRNEAYLFDARTYKAFRGKNLAPYVRHELCNVLKQRGIERLLSISLWSDSSSMKFKKKLGAKPIELFLYFGLFKKFHLHLRLR
jgi:hypothetical protein